MKTSLIALLVLGFASSAFAEHGHGDRINYKEEKVPTYKQKLIPRSKDLFTVHTQYKFKDGTKSKAEVHTNDYSRTVVYEELGHAENKQAELMKKLEEHKERHNKQNYKNPDRQIEEVRSWIEKQVQTWNDDERVRD